MPRLQKIVSGGQTGVDRAALDAAMALGIDHGGWCPLRRRAEDGRIPAAYQLVETESADYKVRTERNVIDSDGTLILARGPLSGGTLLTRIFAEERGKPCLAIDLSQLTSDARRQQAVDDVCQWLQSYGIAIVNVAGPRESQNPGIALDSQAFLQSVFAANGE
jgi:hypothetical protein